MNNSPIISYLEALIYGIRGISSRKMHYKLIIHFQARLSHTKYRNYCKEARACLKSQFVLSSATSSPQQSLQNYAQRLKSDVKLSKILNHSSQKAGTCKIAAFTVEPRRAPQQNLQKIRWATRFQTLKAIGVKNGQGAFLGAQIM